MLFSRIFAFLLLGASSALAQNGGGFTFPPSTGGGVAIATFASPPSSPTLNQAFLFTDASTTGVCTGGGTSYSICVWNGSSFAAIGGTSTGLGDPGANSVVYRNGAGTSIPATATQMSGPNFCQDAGATDAYACNLSPVIASYVTGTLYWFKANTANTGAASINFNGKGALTIKKMIGGITTDLSTGDIVVGQWVGGFYDGTNLQMVSGLGTAVDLTSTQTMTGKTVDGVSPATFAFLDCVSSCQTQLNGKQASLGYTPLAPANNLSDVSNAGTSRTNLGLGNAATQNLGTFFQVANNLSEGTAAAMRTNLGLGTAAQQANGFFLQTANNLSDGVAATMRTNLGLGTAATQNTGTSGANVPLLNGNNTSSGNEIHSGSETFNGAVIASGATRTAPTIVVANVGALPGTCTQGDLAFVSSATAGQQIYECSSTNTWTQQTGGSGSGLADPGANGPIFRSSLNVTRPVTQTDINAIDYVAGGGTANAQTATLSPAVTSYTAGLRVCWLPAAANTTTTPTLAVNGLAATTITKLGTTALASSDLTTTAVACAIYISPNFQLQNPQSTPGAISGLTSTKIPKATSATTIGDSNLAQNADGSLNASQALTAGTPSTPTYNIAGTTAIDLSLSNVINLGSAIGGTTTIAVSNPHGGTTYYLFGCIDGTGGYATLTYPGTFKGVPGFDMTANACNLVQFTYDGSTNYYGPGTTTPGLVGKGPTGTPCAVNPPSGSLCAWFDTTDLTLEVKDSSGNVSKVPRSGVDVGVNGQVTSTHISGGTNNVPAKFNSTGNLVNSTQADMNAIGYVAGGGSANAQTATLSPVVGAYATGLQVCWLPTAANSTTTPTLAVNGLSAITITKLGATALVANDLVTTAVACAIYDATGPRFELQNPNTATAGADCNATTHGLVPTPPNNTTTFLRGDCTFAAPAGGGSAANYTSVSFSATPTFTAGSNTVDAWAMASLTGNVTSSTLASATTGERLAFRICQDGTGGRTFAWPTDFANALAISPVASVCTKEEFFWDGSNARLLGAQTDGGPNAIGDEQAAPGTPAATKFYCWGDSTDHSGWECKANNSTNVYKMTLTGVDLNPILGQLTLTEPTCTNQVVTAMSARGVITCGSVTLSDLATQANATLLSNISGGAAVPSANALPTTNGAFIHTSSANGALAASNITENADSSDNASKALTWAAPSVVTYNSGGTTTCDWSQSNVCKFTMATGNTTLALTNPHGSGPYRIIIIQDSTCRTITYPGTVNAGTQPNCASGAVNIQDFTWDGTSYQGGGQNVTNLAWHGTSTQATAFSGFPACGANYSGFLGWVSDSTTTDLGATITGSGSNVILAWCNGTNWLVANPTTIAANGISLSKLATQANATYLANVSGGTAVPSAAALPTNGNRLIKTIDANGGITNASCTDDGTTVTCPEPIGVTYTMISSVAGSTGVTANLLVSEDSAGRVVTAATSASAVVGFANSTVATPGNQVYVVKAGIFNGVADNSTTQGHVLIPGTTTAGRVKDSGATDCTTIPPTTPIVGYAQTAVSAAAAVSVLLAPGYGCQISVGNLTGLGTGIGTALGVNVGTAGAPVVNGGALGTPSSGVMTNLTGLALGGTPLTTRGDLFVANTATPVLGRLAKGTQYQTLQGGATDIGYDAVHLDQATAVTGNLPAANIGPAATVVNSGTITVPAGNSVLVICTSTCSVPAPVPAAGYQICAKNIAGGTTVITFSALGSSAMYPKSDDSGYGTAGTGTMVSSAAAGNKVCLIGRDSTHYELGAVNIPANWTVN